MRSWGGIAPAATVAIAVLWFGCSGDELSLDWEGGVSPTPSANPSPTATPSPPVVGRDGPLTVPNGDTVTLDNCVEIVSVAGDTVVFNGAVVADRQWLLWQGQAQFATSGDQTTLTSAATLTDAGAWQITTLTNAVDNGDGTWSADGDTPIVSYETLGPRGGMGCRVMEYTDVTVEAGGTLDVAPWNGLQGGMLVFTASGTVTIDGTVSATGSGFRGGTPDGNISAESVTAFDSNDASGKGEGLDGRAWTMTGRGNYANGGGGGSAHNAGGGGGGNGGAGGLGGMQWEGTAAGGIPDTQGLPGVALDLSVFSRCTFGGGGGAGEEHHNTVGPGGNGGGIIVIIAPTIAGSGLMVADGTDGDGGAGGEDAGGGGGAGGTILLAPNAGGDTFAGVISALGGDGGDAFVNYNEAVGPGGGAGGGRVYLGEAFAGATTDLSGGTAGQTMTAAGVTTNYGATNGQPGVIETP